MMAEVLVDEEAIESATVVEPLRDLDVGLRSAFFLGLFSTVGGASGMEARILEGATWAVVAPRARPAPVFVF